MAKVESVSSNNRVGKFSCPDCGKPNFPSASAVSMHRNAKHKHANGKPVQTLHLKPVRKRGLLGKLFGWMLR